MKEESKQQISYMQSIDIGIGVDDNLVVAQVGDLLFYVKSLH